MVSHDEYHVDTKISYRGKISGKFVCRYKKDGVLAYGYLFFAIFSFSSFLSILLILLILLVEGFEHVSVIPRDHNTFSFINNLNALTK